MKSRDGRLQGTQELLEWHNLLSLIQTIIIVVKTQSISNAGKIYPKLSSGQRNVISPKVNARW